MPIDKDETRLTVEDLENKLGSAYQRIRDLEQALAVREQKDVERVKTLRTLVQSEAFLAQSAEIAHLGYAVWDDTLDRDATVSVELARIHGFTRDEYLQNIDSMKAYLELVVPDDRKKYQDYEDQFGADISGKPGGVEYRIQRPDGEIRYLQQRSQYIPNSSSRPTQSIVVIQDVTTQKQVEFRLKTSREALEESESMLMQSVAMANLGHAVWDYVDVKYISVSEGWAGIFGYSAEEFLATFTDIEKDSELIHIADRDRYRAYYENDEEEPEIEYRIVRRNGEIRHVLQRYEYVYDESGEPSKSLVTIQDITKRIERETELNKARNAAEQASVAKSSFLALISHEIRTPLNAVLGALGLIDTEDLDQLQKKFLNVGRKGAESLLFMINDILDFSKIEAGQLHLEPAVFNVRKSIDDVLLVLEQRAVERNISLTGDLDLNVPEFLVGDASRIRQVLLNLCSNAVRFTTEGGVYISITKQKSQDDTVHFRFLVEDTGCGVPLKDHEHLFEEFWGTSTTTIGNAGNTGLGLPISKKLVELMGGSIDFESDPLRGSTFWFDLPLQTPSEEAIEFERTKIEKLNRAAPQADLPTLEGRVLLAEDNPANQLIEQSLLERMGLQVDVVANGHEVIAALSTVPYDIVLMDINMPELDGIEATMAIRNIPGTLSSTPIVAMTALAMPGDRERFLSQGMDDYISKPIIREELYTCIVRVLGGLERSTVASNNSDEFMLADTDSSTIDAEILNLLMAEVGAALMPQIIDTYLSEVPARVEAITAAASCGDSALVAREAHPLKSSSAHLGAISLAELASQLETAGREDNIEKILVEVIHLQRLYEQARGELLKVRHAIEKSRTISSK